MIIVFPVTSIMPIMMLHKSIHSSRFIHANYENVCPISEKHQHLEFESVLLKCLLKIKVNKPQISISTRESMEKHCIQLSGILFLHYYRFVMPCALAIAVTLLFFKASSVKCAYYRSKCR